MQVEGEWLGVPQTRALMDRVQAAGHSIFFVGGCVRNALLGVPVADVDLATSARPDEVMQLGESAGLRVHPTGIDHGTVTVATDRGPLEVTTFRRDVETDGRRAVVSFSDSIEEDASRRDLTMNALYADQSGQVYDPLGGLQDIEARRVRFIGVPAQRIREDYLRILRFFRFFAYYGDPAEGLHAESLAACAEETAGLETLSKERIGAEILKLFSAPDPAPAAAAMEKCGALMRILPGSTSEYVAPLVHLENGMPPNPIRRLAALGLRDPKSTLRLSTAQLRDLQTVRAGVQADISVAELAYRNGYNLALDTVLVKHALMGQILPSNLEDDLSLGTRAVMPVKAADLPDFEGRALGVKLKEIERRWIGSGFTLTRDQLLSGGT